jgi:hypothetical protein
MHRPSRKSKTEKQRRAHAIFRLAHLFHCRLVRKEYGIVRNRTDCIAREFFFRQEFRIFDRIFVRAMLKECWSSELRRAKSSKIYHVTIEEDGNDALRGGEIRMRGYIKYVMAISHWLGSFIEFSKTKLKWIKRY